MPVTEAKLLIAREPLVSKRATSQQESFIEASAPHSSKSESGLRHTSGGEGGRNAPIAPDAQGHDTSHDIGADSLHTGTPDVPAHRMCRESAPV